LDRVSVLKHRHAKIVDGGNCTGCLQCMAACEVGAIMKL
jgi:ferredoxin